ncbi:MAG: hypothetical protein IPI87_07360 [Betaproteobacteria bacterium]|nr:hypothetical protein [Betaproteobacteria bacterium]
MSAFASSASTLTSSVWYTSSCIDWSSASSRQARRIASGQRSSTWGSGTNVRKCASSSGMTPW